MKSKRFPGGMQRPDDAELWFSTRSNPCYHLGSVSVPACSASFLSPRRRIAFLISRHVRAMCDLWIGKGAGCDLRKHFGIWRPFYISASESPHAFTNPAAFYVIKQQPRAGFGVCPPQVCAQVGKQRLRSRARCV